MLLGWKNWLTREGEPRSLGEADHAVGLGKIIEQQETACLELTFSLSGNFCLLIGSYIPNTYHVPDIVAVLQK